MQFAADLETCCCTLQGFLAFHSSRVVTMARALWEQHASKQLALDNESEGSWPSDSDVLGLSWKNAGHSRSKAAAPEAPDTFTGCCAVFNAGWMVHGS